jgi:ElaB/YqjD/DUF883 family membrane-anchored ribosome-binding protein
MATKKTRKVSVKTVASKSPTIKAQAKVLSKKTTALAKKNPWAVAGIAAGLGLAVGILSTRGKGKKKKK